MNDLTWNELHEMRAEALDAALRDEDGRYLDTVASNTTWNWS